MILSADLTVTIWTGTAALSMNVGPVPTEARVLIAIDGPILSVKHEYPNGRVEEVFRFTHPGETSGHRGIGFENS
jgi:hypothetical protein